MHYPGRPEFGVLFFPALLNVGFNLMALFRRYLLPAHIQKSVVTKPIE